MRKIATTLIFLLYCSVSSAYQPREGDILFQTSTSSQSLAIQQATGSPYSHMGIVLLQHGKPYVFEASSTVRYTPLADWIKRGKEGHYVAKRLATPLSTEQTNVLHQEAQRYKNKPYDLTFEWSDTRMYCSELVWKMYQRATGLEIGKLQPIKEFKLNTPEVQKKVKERYGKQVPEDSLVISPAAMFDDPKLITVIQ